MTNPLHVTPNNLLTVAHGHLALINQLGQAIDLTPDVPQGPWPSQAGVAGMHGATTAMTAAMMARLGQHSTNLTQTAASYHNQEDANTTTLNNNALGDLANTLTHIADQQQPT